MNNLILDGACNIIAKDKAKINLNFEDVLKNDLLEVLKNYLNFNDDNIVLNMVVNDYGKIEVSFYMQASSIIPVNRIY